MAMKMTRRDTKMVDAVRKIVGEQYSEFQAFVKTSIARDPIFKVADGVAMHIVEKLDPLVTNNHKADDFDKLAAICGYAIGLFREQRELVISQRAVDEFFIELDAEQKEVVKTTLANACVLSSYGAYKTMGECMAEFLEPRFARAKAMRELAAEIAKEGK